MKDPNINLNFLICTMINDSSLSLKHYSITM